MKRLAGGIFAALLILIAITVPVQATQGSPEQKVTLCHAKPADTAKNGYVQITVDVAAASGLKKFQAHAMQHDADIIPAFSFGSFTYAGKNLDAGGQAILDNGCQPSEGPSATPGDSPDESCGTDLDEVGDNDVDNNPCPSESPSATPSVTPSPTPSETPTPTPTATPTPPPSTAPPSAPPTATPTLPVQTLPPTDTESPDATAAGLPWLALVIAALALAFGAITLRKRVR